MTETGQGAEPQGVGAAWQRLLSRGGVLMQSRMELAAIELGEERQRLQTLLLFGLVAVFFGLLALGSLTALLVILFWNLGHWQVLTLLSLLYAGVAAYCAYRLREALRNAPPPFAATRAEFAKDSAVWRARH
ncbi:MAG: phage holin family protein [Thiomonas sp.]|nr:phage holin family protein [Thiomonas sp.]